MKILPLAACIIALAASLSGAAPERNYPSLPSKVFSTYSPSKPEAYTPEAMASAAGSFLKSLKQNLRRQAALPYDSPEKAKWTNVPPRGPQGGVRLGDLNEKQMKKACDLLAAVLSPQGYGQHRHDEGDLSHGRAAQTAHKGLLFELVGARSRSFAANPNARSVFF